MSVCVAYRREEGYETLPKNLLDVGVGVRVVYCDESGWKEKREEGRKDGVEGVDVCG